MFGREISRGLIAALRADGLIAAGPRSPKIGVPYAYVTTEKYLVEFGFESLRDLPGIEALKDAGLTPTGGQLGATKGNGGGGRQRPVTTTRGFARSRRVAAYPCRGWGRGSNRAAGRPLLVKVLFDTEIADHDVNPFYGPLPIANGFQIVRLSRHFEMKNGLFADGHYSPSKLML